MEQINKLTKEVEDLRRILQKKQDELCRIKSELSTNQCGSSTGDMAIPGCNTSHQTDNTNCYQEPQTSLTKETVIPKEATTRIGDKLPTWAIERYSRQILLPEIGVHGQEKLCSAKVLIVGAGGLGCPAGVYLAGAGIGEIGIVDYDTVDLTNIHRQFLHGEKDQFMSKAESAANSLRSINSRIKVTAHSVQLDSQNAVQIASQYDIVLDCTDNVPTRYLLNDLCVLTKIPLISGSALKMDGQLTLYGYRAINNTNEKDCSYIGPCYRCVFPTPPPAETVGSCSANGVAGPVTGAIGALQALEAIKYIVGQTHTQLLVGRMLLFDGEDMTFRTVKLRARSVHCAVCSDSPTITRLIDYEVFCKAQAKEKKKQESRLKSELRKHEKEKRMSGQRYYGFRTNPDGTNIKKWVQDVPKSERKMGPACKSDNCAKGTAKKCSNIDESNRSEVFHRFWNELDWKGKRGYVKSLVDSVPIKRRRLKIKGVVSRKGDSKMYHLMCRGERVPVCRVMFLNTLGVKEAMVRHWLLNEDRPKATKQPIKSINVDSYLDSLPKLPPKCQFCINNGSKLQYINIQHVKNQFQLYNMYAQEMKLKNCVPASRKTFSKVVNLKNVRIFKAKSDTDICDVIKEHNMLPSLSYESNDLDLHILPSQHRITPSELSKQLRDCEQSPLLVDVRSEAEFNMCRIDGSTNFPVEKLGESLERLLGVIREEKCSVTFICRRGNDSQLAAKRVIEAIEKEHRGRIRDLSGGLHAWASDVDKLFPIY